MADNPLPRGPTTITPGEFPPPSAFKRLAYHTCTSPSAPIQIAKLIRPQPSSSTRRCTSTAATSPGKATTSPSPASVRPTPLSHRPHHAQPLTRADNNTLTLDLATSWNNQSITFGVIPKMGTGAPVLHYASAWAAPDRRSFYSFGGLGAWIAPTNDSAPWQFTPDGRGNGTWARVPDPADGRGYFLGGLATADGMEAPPFGASPGLLTWDMAANAWTNASATAVAPWGAAMYGRMQVVLNFGQQGVLLAFGGEGTDADLTFAGTMDRALGLDEIGVYDIATRTWYRQRATGYTQDAIPSKRELFCSVGADGGNGTYEIFLYGGEAGNHYWSRHDQGQAASNATNAQKTGVHVLSLPSFTWFKANDTSAAPRSGHTCETTGDRQMISIGGYNATGWPNDMPWNSDSSTYGIGVFDMTDLTWRDSYDAHAAQYSTPNVVRQWYAANR